MKWYIIKIKYENANGIFEDDGLLLTNTHHRCKKPHQCGILYRFRKNSFFLIKNGFLCFDDNKNYIMYDDILSLISNIRDTEFAECNEYLLKFFKRIEKYNEKKCTTEN